MATINRFNTPLAPERFNPLSFEEMSVAPIALRQREDTLLNQQDELLNNLNNITVPDIYQDQFNKEKENYIQEIEKLAQTINKDGAGNLNVIGDLRNLRNRYNKSVSESGLIGRAAGVKAGLDKIKEQYYKFALEQGWGSNPDLINKNWEKVKQDYINKLPKDLSKVDGNMPEFNPAYSPKKSDLVSEINTLKGLVGSTKAAYGNFSMQPQRDPNTNEIINYTIVNEKGEDITNEPQLQALKSYMVDRVLNPNSELNQTLQYQGVNPQDHLANVDNIISMMNSSASSRVQSYAGQTAVSGNRNGSSSSSSISTGGEASFIEASNGMNRLANSLSTRSISAAIEDINKDNSLSYEEKQARILAYNHALQKKKKIEEDPKFKEEINKAIKTNSKLQSMGISSFEEYTSFINDPKNQKQNDITSYGAPGLMQFDVQETLAEQAESFYQESYSKLPKDILADSAYYTLGPNKADTDLQKIMSEGITNVDLRDLASTNALAIRSNDTNEFGKIGPTNDEDSYSEFMNTIENSTNVKYSLRGIDDGGLAGDAALVYHVTGKSGDKNFNYTISLDMQNNDLSRALLSPSGDLYQSLDKKSRSVLDNIRDNKLDYRVLATDVNINTAFDSQGTANILNHSSVANNELGLIPRTSDSALNNYLFVKKDDSNYSVIINEDNSYSMYKKDKNNKTSFMTIGDLSKKMMASMYLKNPNNKIGVLESDEQFKETYKASFVNNLIDNITIDIDNPSAFGYYSDNAQYKKIIKEYYNAVESKSPDLFKKALDTYDKISNMKLQSKSVKHIL